MKVLAAMLLLKSLLGLHFDPHGGAAAARSVWNHLKVDGANTIERARVHGKDANTNDEAPLLSKMARFAFVSAPQIGCLAAAFPPCVVPCSGWTDPSLPAVQMFSERLSKTANS